jgi:hypothetical protein
MSPTPITAFGGIHEQLRARCRPSRPRCHFQPGGGRRLRQPLRPRWLRHGDEGRYRSDDRYDRGHRHHNDGAPIVGALIGGAIGNQFGHGDGRVAATVAGALIGAAIASDGRDYDRDDRYSYYGRRDWHDHRYNQGYRYGYGGYGGERRYDYRDGRYCHGR